MAAHVLTSKDPFRVKVEFSLWQLESFIHISQKASEEFARRSKRDLEESISKTLQENSSLDPIVAIHIHSVSEYVSAHHEAIPRYSGYSFVINVYNLFEDLGKNLHKELMRREIIPKAAGLSSNHFLERFKAFTEQAGIPFIEYSTLRDFKDVRNNIVHRGGNLEGEKEEDKQKILRIIETNSTALSVRDGQIQVAAEYAIENLNLIKQFFSKALDQKGFEDGYSFSTPSKPSFGVSFREGKVTIEVTDSTAEPEADKEMKTPNS